MDSDSETEDKELDLDANSPVCDPLSTVGELESPLDTADSSQPLPECGAFSSEVIEIDSGDTGGSMPTLAISETVPGDSDKS